MINNLIHLTKYIGTYNVHIISIDNKVTIVSNN